MTPFETSSFLFCILVLASNTSFLYSYISSSGELLGEDKAYPNPWLSTVG